jgi:protein-tyrosine-phosphatase
VRRWGGRRVLAVVPVIALLAGAGCGESPEDEAREEGKELGQAVHQLYEAETSQEIFQAMDRVVAARDNLRSDVRKVAGEQLEVQSDSLADATEAIGEAATATTAQELDDARQDLRNAIQNIRAQAETFESQNDALANAFWRGFQEGYDGG